MRFEVFMLIAIVLHLGMQLKQHLEVVQDEKFNLALSRSRRVVRELVDSVKSVLLSEISKGGYVQAIRGCSKVAQDIVEAYRRKFDLYVRRVSERYRNRADIPDDYEMKILKMFEKMNREGNLPFEHYEVIEEDGKRYFRYMKPLVVNPICLNCHGTEDDIRPEVRRILKEKYPDDRATGYKVGDLRGAVSVRIELDKLK
jgi:hypothetical protein